jgi:SAM-dependent methyltransferase
MTRGYGRLDPWTTIDRADVEQVRRLAARLELRAKNPDEIAARSASLDLLAIRPGERVLDVGCGSGVVLRDLARRVGPQGCAVGVEYNAAFLPIARELAEQEGLTERIELHQGDARALPFSDGEFDLALAVTVLRHIPGADRAVAQMTRVVRPGGRVAVFEGDTDGCLINHPDRELTRRVVMSGTDDTNLDGQLARRLPGVLLEAGLENVHAQAFTTLERDPNGFFAERCVRWATGAAHTGAISAAERDRWLEALRQEQVADRYLVAQIQILAWGYRPSADVDSVNVDRLETN